MPWFGSVKAQTTTGSRASAAASPPSSAPRAATSPRWRAMEVISRCRACVSNASSRAKECRILGLDTRHLMAVVVGE